MKTTLVDVDVSSKFCEALIAVANKCTTFVEGAVSVLQIASLNSALSVHILLLIRGFEDSTPDFAAMKEIGR
jgi:hypothetical protein